MLFQYGYLFFAFRIYVGGVEGPPFNMRLEFDGVQTESKKKDGVLQRGHD